MAEWFYKSTDGVDRGPFTPGEFSALAAAGTVNSSVWVREGVEGPWRPFGNSTFGRSAGATKSNVSDGAPSKSFRWKRLVIPAALVAGWAYLGFPSPETLSHYSSAKNECVEFAEKNRDKLFQNGRTIKAVDSWFKNGKIVVELGAFDSGSTSYMPRICLVGGGSIQIVSMFEAGSWR